MGFLFLAIGFCACDTYRKLDINNISSEEEIHKEKQYIVDAPFRGSIESTVVYEGYVDNQNIDEYYDDVVLKYVNDEKECKLNVLKGEKIKKDEVIGNSYINNNFKTIRYNSNGVVDNIIINEKKKEMCVRILNYELIMFTIKIREEEKNNITYNSNVYIENAKELKCAVEYISTYIDEEGYIDVKIRVKNNDFIVPGEKKKICVSLGKSENALYLSRGSIIDSGDEYYVIVKDEDDNYIEKQIKVGNLVKVLEDGHEWEYYEILDGLEENELVYVERGNDINVEAEKLLDIDRKEE